MKKNLLPVLLLSATCLFLLSGCDEKLINKAVEDPKYLPGAYASIASAICVILIIFQSWSIWRSLLNTVRYMGILCVVAGPLFWLSTENMEAAIALVVTGVLSSLMVTVVFWNDFKNWSSSD